MATIAIAWLILRHNDLDPTLTRSVMLYGAGVACLWMVLPALRYWRTEVVLSGDELRVYSPPFGGTRSARVSEIERVVEHANGIARHLGYGTVVIYGREGSGATLRHVRDASGLCRALIDTAKAAARPRR